mgnify:CR=1 FL=1
MEARSGGLGGVVDELHTRMVAAWELMKQLAEQNTQLVQRIEANRVRTLWLAALSVAGLVVAVVALSNQA